MRHSSSLWIPCVVLALLLGTPRSAAAGPQKLWIGWESSTTPCKPTVIDFWSCVLGQTDFNTLLVQYPPGVTLTLGGTADVNCNINDYDCVANQGGFAVSDGDIVLHYWGGDDCVTGHNHWDASAKGHPIHGAEVHTDNGTCHCQTALGMHEVYEAAGDSINADCCNGQVFGQLSPACGNAQNFGWYILSCGGQMYEAQQVSKASDMFTPAGCTKLSQGCDGGGAVLNQPCAADADCCSGLTCQNWSYSGDPPYTTFCCKAVGEDCSGNTDCCGGSNCDGGKCGCVPEGAWCINADECCAGQTCDLDAHSCVVAPAMASSSSSSSSRGSGGAPGSGGAGDGGAPGAGNGGQQPSSDAPSDAASDSGCGCRVTGEGSGAAAWPAALAIAITLLRRRKPARPGSGQK